MIDADRRHPIWLVRHAPTSWTGQRWCGRADPPLSEEGQGLAAELAATLAAELPRTTIVLTSPASRARATAQAMAAASALTVAVDDELVEVDVGRIEGLDWGELSTREPATADAILAGGLVDWPGGETAREVDERARRAAHRVRVRAVDRPVVVVSHGAFLSALARALGSTTVVRGIDPCGVIRIAS